jgi:hypothetical protein
MNRTARRIAKKITGAMIDHAAHILTVAEENGGQPYTHTEDGETFVCPGCVVKHLRAQWGTKVKQPQTEEQWEALGCVAFNLVEVQAKLDGDKIAA